MPWKSIADPYKIWISEIILQQTRVAQGWDYYLKFINQFPDIISLARAPISRVLKAWEGLGYYTRARNLHVSAAMILNKYQGKFPDNYQEIISLKGVGSYTAAAISSFAFNLPHAVLDGNVHRILSRFLGVNRRMVSASDKKYFQSIADQLLDISSPARYNQAIMDFGAICCTPQNPKCSQCPLNKNCYAFNQDAVHTLPPAKIKSKKKDRFFHYFIIKNEKNHLAMNQRTGKDIWTGLYEFPMVETQDSSKPSIRKIKKELGEVILTDKAFLSNKQILSHQIIYSFFYLAKNELEKMEYPMYSLNKINSIGKCGNLVKDFEKIVNTVISSS